MPALTTFEVTPDHPVPISPQGGTATVTVLSGDTLYYADTPQVSAANNQGSVTAGNVQSFTNPAWIRSASLSTVLVQITARGILTSDLPASVVTATPSGGAAATTTSVLLDTYWNSTIYASKTAAMQSAILAATNAGTTDGKVVATAGKTYALDSGVPNHPPNVRFHLDGNWASFTLNAAAPRLLDPGRTANHQVFTAKVERFYVDASACPLATSGDSHHTIYGNLTGGAFLNCGFTDCLVRDIVATGLPTDITNTATRAGVAMVPYGIIGDATQDPVTNINVQRVRVQGGNIGIDIGGDVGGGATTVQRQACSVWVDDVRIQDCYHDTGVSNYTATVTFANFQVGHFAQVGKVWITNCDGRGSADVGIEIDNATDTTLRGNTLRDAGEVAVLWKNFRAPEDPNFQNLTMDDNTLRWDNVVQTEAETPLQGGTLPCYGIFLGTTNSSTFPMGTITIRKTRVRRKQSSTLSVTGSDLMLDRSQFDRLIIDDFRSRNLNVSFANTSAIGSANAASNIKIRVPSPGAVVTLRDVDLRVVGNYTGAGAVGFVHHGIDLDGVGPTRATLDGYRYDWQVTNMNNATGSQQYGIGIAAGDTTSCQLRLSIRRYDLPSAAPATSNQVRAMRIYNMSGSAGNAVHVEYSDWGNTPAAPEWVNGASTSQLQFGRGMVFRSNPPAPVTVTPPATGVYWQNTTGFDGTLVVSGGTVTGIDVSHNGSTGVGGPQPTGQTAGAFRIPAGQYLRWNGTVAPTEFVFVPAGNAFSGT